MFLRSVSGLDGVGSGGSGPSRSRRMCSSASKGGSSSVVRALGFGLGGVTVFVDEAAATDGSQDRRVRDRGDVGGVRGCLVEGSVGSVLVVVADVVDE